MSIPLRVQVHDEEKKIAVTRPDLPYPDDALAPHISAKSLDFHHGKHHNAYITNLNKLIAETDLAGAALAGYHQEHNS